MPNGGWGAHFGGDLNMAKELQSEYQRGGTADRRGRAAGVRGGRGGRGGSDMTHGGSSFANRSNGRRNLATAPPSHLWEPVNNPATASDGRGDPMNIDDDHGMGNPQWASHTHTAVGPAPVPAAQTGTGSVPTPPSWGTTTTQSLQPALTPAPWVSNSSSWVVIPHSAPSNTVRVSAPEPSRATTPARNRAASPHRGLSNSIHAPRNNDSYDSTAMGAAKSQSATRDQVTWGARNTLVSIIKPFNSTAHHPVTNLQMKDVQNGNTTPKDIAGAGRGMASATEADRQLPGLKASRHAGCAGPTGPAALAGHKQNDGMRCDLLQENGQLVGVRFLVDQGPKQDDDWLSTYNLEQVKNKYFTIAGQAFAAGDHEAVKVLRRVVNACDEVLRAKNELKDEELKGEAARILSKSQYEARFHWIKYSRPVPPAANLLTPNRAQDENPNVRLQDTPVFAPQQVEQVEHVQIPHAPTQPQPRVSPIVVAASGPAQAPAASQRTQLGNADSDASDPVSFQQQSIRTTQNSGFDYTPSRGFGASSFQQLPKPAAQQAQVAGQQPIRTTQFGGFGSTHNQQDLAPTKELQSTQQPQDSQQPTLPTGLPSMFPRGLPADFDDPQAREIFEEFFFRNNRLDRK